MANNLKGLCNPFLINVNIPLNKSLKCCFCCTILDQKQKGCGGSICKFPILLLFHIFLLDQSCLNTIAAHILSLRTICLNIYGERNFHAIPQISLNLTKYLSSWGSPHWWVVANLGTDGKSLHALTIYGEIWFFITENVLLVPTNKLPDRIGKQLGGRLCRKRMFGAERSILYSQCWCFDSGLGSISWIWQLLGGKPQLIEPTQVAV